MKIFKNEKKGQAALEFLTTYGWAFLVILVMIGALAYFGVLDPTRFIPQRCQFGQELYCERFAMTTTQAAFELRNNLPDSMHIDTDVATSVEYAPDDDLSEATGWTNCGGASVMEDNTGVAITEIPRNNAANIVCVFAGADSLTEGEKARRHFRIIYSTGNSFSPTLSSTIYGEIFANVR